MGVRQPPDKHSLLCALLLCNSVEGDNQAAQCAGKHIGEALDGAIQAAEHLSNQNLLGRQLGQFVDALGIHSAAVNEAGLHREVLIVLGILGQDLGGVHIAVLAVSDGSSAMEMLLQALDTSFLESQGQQGVLDHLVLAASLTQLLTELGVLFHRDAFIVHQDTHIGLFKVFSQLGNLLVSYTTVNLADINVGSALMDVFGVLQTQNLALPPSFTLLARGMVTIEGVLVDIAPDTSVIDIIAAHVKRRERTWEAFETKAREFVSTAATSAQAAVRLPTQASHTLDMIDRGQVRVGADLGIPIDAIAALYSVSGTVAMALISAGLFIGSSLLATTNMHPQFLGVPLLGVLGYVGAFVLGAYVVWRNLVIRHRQKNEEKL